VDDLLGHQHRVDLVRSAPESPWKGDFRATAVDVTGTSLARGEVFRRPVRALWPRVILRFGRRAGDDFLHEEAVVVAAHADDETLGCGATIALKRSTGADVRIVVATDGRLSPPNVDDHQRVVRQRLEELRVATAKLGVPAVAVESLGLPDGALTGQIAAVSKRVADMLREHSAAHVFTHSRWDPHPDHHATWVAVSEAVKAIRRERPDSRLVCYEFPIWDWTLGPWPPTATTSGWGKVADLVRGPAISLTRGRAFLVPTAEAMSQKRAALAAYQSQISPWEGHPPALPAAFVERLCGPYEVFLPGP